MRGILVDQSDAGGFFVEGIDDLMLIGQDGHDLGIEDAQFLALEGARARGRVGQLHILRHNQRQAQGRRQQNQ